jgi:hypothetical protein
MLHHFAISRILIPAIPAALFIYASTRPVTTLSPEMPAQFVDIPRHATARQRAAEKQIAQQYWNCAVELIRWQYTYGSPLPEKPPDDFQMYPGNLVDARGRHDSRRRYWRRLRNLWNSPEAWVTSREWSKNWLTDLLSDAVEAIREYLSSLIRTG